jgi:hypothetical protein
VQTPLPPRPRPSHSPLAVSRQGAGDGGYLTHLASTAGLLARCAQWANPAGFTAARGKAAKVKVAWAPPNAGAVEKEGVLVHAVGGVACGVAKQASECVWKPKAAGSRGGGSTTYRARCCGKWYIPCDYAQSTRRHTRRDNGGTRCNGAKPLGMRSKASLLSKAQLRYPSASGNKKGPQEETQVPLRR